MKISELAKSAGVNIETIRYYERRHLITQPIKPTQGYRAYPQATLERVLFIKRAQELGFTLQEIANLLVELVTTTTTDNHQQLIVEQQLFSEVQVTPALRAIAKEHHLAQLQPCLQLCQYFAQDNLEINAEILLTQIQQICYRQLLADNSQRVEKIHSIINQALAIVIRVKP